MQAVHQSVLVNEVLDLLAPEDGDRLMVDATVGEGGHSACFLQQYPSLSIVGVDADGVMIERARERLEEFGERVQLVHQWFDAYFQSSHLERPHRILMDLGVSMFHFAQAGRGFSFREDGPLDMRLDADDTLRPNAPDAAELVNSLPEQELADVIFRYGEERLSRRIAAAICRERGHRPIRSSAQLADLIRGAVPPSYRHGRIHPATRTFQALRIAVNGELERIQRAIPAALDILLPGGRLGVISFHSLEDRIVKYLFRDAAEAGGYTVVTRKPVIATEEEQRANPASRTAKLRVIERGAAA